VQAGMRQGSPPPTHCEETRRLPWLPPRGHCLIMSTTLVRSKTPWYAERTRRSGVTGAHRRRNMSSAENHRECSRSRWSLLQIFDLFRSSYGPQHWWPGDSPFEVIVGAVLTQNTAWHNVAQAIANLKREGLLQPGALLRAERDSVKALLAPAGYYNIKYDRLMSLLRFLDGYGRDLERLRSLPLEGLRTQLLEVKGVGPETADSILLYALQRPVFVVDAYTRRLFSRLGYGWMQKASYSEIQEYFMEALPPDTALYNECHALIVVHCKDTCKKKPLCEGCCLRSLCAALGRSASESCVPLLPGGQVK
jgi:endonuclease-3 related protein